jgi:hypothetical protein
MDAQRKRVQERILRIEQLKKVVPDLVKPHSKGHKGANNGDRGDSYSGDSSPDKDMAPTKTSMP